MFQQRGRPVQAGQPVLVLQESGERETRGDAICHEGKAGAGGRIL